MAQFLAQADASPTAGPKTVCGKGYETLQFEKTLQGALKTLRESLEEHMKLKKKYEHTISRLTEILQNVPPESKVFSGLETTNNSFLLEKYSAFYEAELQLMISLRCCPLIYGRHCLRPK
jgi:hypothetical protein